METVFNQILTLKNRATGEHRTFQIKTVRKGALAGKRIAALLTGPDNESDYQGFGFVESNAIRPWGRARGTVLEVYAALLTQLLFGTPRGFKDLGKYEIQASRRCLRCNRTLTTPESIERGIGPECAGKA